MALARYNANGTLDTSFGSNGQVTAEFGTEASALAVVLQPDGRIIAAGKVTTPAADGRITAGGIVAITAAPINEVMEQIRSSGMNDYVSKPFKPSELFTKLEQYLVVDC